MGEARSAARRRRSNRPSPLPEARRDPAGPMTPDEWQAHVTREAALEIGRWLEA
jgi:hypothetical protein